MKKSEFSRIIGFDSVKEELSIIGDMFNDPEKYEQIGAEIPKGILLYGEPGIGKTTFAYSFMEASGVSSYIIRRNKNNSAFIEEIGNTFEEAKNNTPSIILLDDLDKFTKDRDSIEEYSVVQACIDSVSKQNVLVMATVNEIDRIPSSLIRSGRFDRIINMSLSIGDIVSGNHWKYFLNNRVIDIEVDEDDISKMFYLVSPSNIKNIMNDYDIIYHLLLSIVHMLLIF